MLPLEYDNLPGAHVGYRCNTNRVLLSDIEIFMGIYDREYYRDESSGFSQKPIGSSMQSWPVWKKIIALTVGVFILQLLFSPVTNWLSLSYSSLMSGKIWTLLTYAFAHSSRDIFHILFNMLLLYFFGRRLESMYGSKEFGLLYCVSAIFAGFFIILLSFIFWDSTPTIGASGAVLALLIIYALHFPREKIYLFGIVPIEIRWVAGFIIIMDLFPVLKQFGGQDSSDGISHAGHLGGALFGYLYYKFRLRLSPLLSGFTSSSRFKMPGRGPSLKIYSEESSKELEAEVDRILQKINEQGESSLTNKERKVLKNASKHYKKRNS